MYQLLSQLLNILWSRRGGWLRCSLHSKSEGDIIVSCCQHEKRLHELTIRSRVSSILKSCKKNAVEIVTAPLNQNQPKPGLSSTQIYSAVYL